MEIKAKLSLAVNEFKSGLNTAKKELDSLGSSGSKFNSKFAKDVRGSFDNIGSGIRSSIKGSLNNAWNPLQQGFSKAAAKIATNSAVIGGFFRNMTKSAADNAKAIDAYTERNMRNKIIGLQRASDFEARVAQANRRLDKQRMVDQYGARPAGSATTRPNGPAVTPKNAESDYTKWWASELNRRLDYVKKHESAAIAASVKGSVTRFASEAKYNVQLGGMWAKETAKRVVGDAKAGVQIAGIWASTRAKQLSDDMKYNREYRALQRDVRKEEFNSQVKGFDSGAWDKSMASTRYALYDVGQRFIAFGTVVTNAFAQAVQASAQFESSFTSVERSTGMVLGESGGAAEKLRAQLIDLSTTIPVSFEQIARIATLGAQMGIASDSVDNFAETVSKFSAITGISAETAAQSFGRLGQLLGINANEFENLSSAITYTGVNSVATDQEILSMSESIAAAGKQAGFSADQVIGMSAALASLKIRPEEARGVLARLFREIDLQVAQAGTGLGDFAQTLGTTSDKAAALWKQNPSGFFQKFLEGAQSTGKLNETLVALGITNTREMNVIQRLSQNTGMLSKTMADAERQYMLGTYSSKAYGLVVDDLNSKFTIFQSTLAKMSASFGDAMSGGVKVAVDILTTLANAIGQLPTGIKWLVAILGILGATAAFVFGGLALGIAGLLAMKLALGNLAREGINASISFRTLGALMMSLAPTSGAAAAAMRLLGFSVKTTETGVKSLSVSMKSMLMSTGIGIAIAGLSMIFDAMANSANNANNSALAVGNAMLEAGGGADAFSQALAADQAAISKGAEAIGTLTLAYDEHNKARVASEQQGLAVGRASESINKAYAGEAAASGKLTDGVSALNDATAIYNDTISQTGELTKTVTANMGAKTAAFYVEALSKYKGANGDQATFWEAYLNPDNAQGRKIAEAMGFKFSGLISSGMKKAGGATEYIDSFKAKVRELDNQLNQLGNMAGPEARASLIQQYGKDAGWTAEQIQLIADKGSTLGGVSATLDSMYTAFGNAATGVDGLRTQLEQNQAVIEQNSQAMQQLGYSAEVADGLVGGLAETLKGYMDAAFSGAAANNAAADSFQTYATGISDVSDGLSGARQDAANWVSYMNAAREAAVQNGEGFAGSVKRILAGIEALAKAGKDTKKPFEDMKLYLENAAKGEGFGTLAVEIAKATDPKQLDGLIRAWMLTDAVTKDATGQAKAYGETLLTALSTDPELVKTLLASFSNITSSAGKAKTAIEKMSEALDKLFEKFNRKMNLEAAFDSLGASLAKNKKNFNAFTEDGRSNITALQEVISQLAISADGDKQKMANSLQSLKTAFMQMGVVGGTAMNLINIALKSTGKTGKNIASAIKNAVKSITGAFTDALTADTKDSVRLVGDYVNDLQSIISDAFDNRYGKQTGLDEIASAWESIRDSAKSAQQAVDDANRSIAELNVDKNLLEYQLKVAVKYGDTKRQIAIKNKLAEVNSKLADESAKISESVASRDKTLDVKNNSKAAIENRNQVRGMVKTYTDYLATLAKTGMSSEDLKKQAATMAAEFLTQGQNLGFAKEELSAYTSAFEGDFTKAIDALPQDYTLTVNTDPALRAIETFVQKANDALSKIVIPGSDKVAATPKPTAEEIAAYKKYKTVIADPKATYVSKIDARESMGFFEGVFGSGYKGGGLIKGAGTGTSDSIPARLSNGEYVVNANAVSKYGVDFMNSLNQMRASGPMPSSVGVGMGSGGSSMVYLSPEDRQLLRAAIDRPVALYTENTKIAASANAGNLLLAQRGSN